MKSHHFKSSKVTVTWVRMIPILIFIPCLALSVAAKETKNRSNSKGSDEPAANGDWNQASFNAAHTGYNRYETEIDRNNVGSLTQTWISQVGLGTLYSSPVVA